MDKQIKVSALVSSYNTSKYLPAFLDNCAEQTIKDTLEIVLVHNQPSQGEIDLVKEFQTKHPNLIKHIVVSREPFPASVNRAIKEAAGEYVCVWNVDDLRTKNSLEIMAKTLDENPEAGFTYGDYTIVRKWLGKEGKLISPPEFQKQEFVEGMHLGPFFMWRKSLCNTLGFWDEQLISGCDFDFAARLAVMGEGKKTIGLLGYYLDEGLGLSTGKTPWQPIERTVIELRFGIYHKLDFLYYKRAKKYRIKEILEFGKWTPVEKVMPGYMKYSESKFLIFYAALRYPFWIVKRIVRKLIRMYGI